MDLKDILGLSALAVVFGGLFTAICVGYTAQRKKIVCLSLELNDKQRATYIAEETVPYDIIELVLEKKHKTTRSKLDQMLGITRYERVRGIVAKSAGHIVITGDGRLILDDSISFMSHVESGAPYYVDKVVKPQGVKRGYLYSGNSVSVEISSLDVPFDVEVHLCTSWKAKLLGYKQT